ncbi:hypothetical protein O181_103425 [Austropuccinia psidii MF-1]|uniref:Uncharacterized protein n=1 Tax=Austropuccinia psidii MF-1 TaxID=1389203 RepID=A0A9Q3JLK7_9BASI|nr:hypothetical protein [Austropuccinia psidii MF-1]
MKYTREVFSNSKHNFWKHNRMSSSKVPQNQKKNLTYLVLEAWKMKSRLQLVLWEIALDFGLAKRCFTVRWWLIPLVLPVQSCLIFFENLFPARVITRNSTYSLSTSENYSHTEDHFWEGLLGSLLSRTIGVEGPDGGAEDMIGVRVRKKEIGKGDEEKSDERRKQWGLKKRKKNTET